MTLPPRHPTALRSTSPTPATATPKFVPGQRWVSESEPELGLGTLLTVGFREVRIAFKAAETERVYMHRNAPLRRVRLEVGDRARTQAGVTFVVERVREKEGLLIYEGGKTICPEGELLDRMVFSDPDKRLLAAQVDDPEAWDLRQRTLRFRQAMQGSRVRGFCGARMQLLEHQLSIAYEVASRHHPRVLLADEVGLGKTIEAGLIFHRLFVSGQITRVIIVTPVQLVHQWLVEMYRRFNHMFTVVDEELCRSEEKGDTTKNPLAMRQTLLCEIDFFARSAKRVDQAVTAGIDLLIVDEAHHLGWSAQKTSPEYAAIAKLASSAKGVLLLTATPIQLGQAGHFGRLRLLDPDRFQDLPSFVAESDRFQELAGTVDQLLASEIPIPAVARVLEQRFPQDTALQARVSDYLKAAKGSRQALVDDLIDRHGTGRMLFRNRRQALGGFPPRVVHATALAPNEESRLLAEVVLGKFLGTVPGSLKENELAKWLAGAGAYTSNEVSGVLGDPAAFLAKALRRDPRIDWLVELLGSLKGEKVLLIASHKNVIFALQELLPTLTAAPFSVFHENLTMTTRDRNAAWFADPAGAQILLCSEIGSEGRNFQFAHHLVLFDLPLDPSILEQRIGRLDRIGQSSEIHLHIPYLAGSAHELIFRWYHEGLNAFNDTVLGADHFHEVQIEEVLSLSTQALRAMVAGTETKDDWLQPATQLIEKTKSLAADLRATLEKGRDRLLEINSNRPAVARALIAEIKSEDEDEELEAYLEQVFDHFGLDVQPTAQSRGYFVFPGERMTLDSFPGVTEQGLAFTFDREEAIAREDLAFMSLDHPLVRGAVDLILDNQEGTTGFIEWREAPERGLALEVLFVLSATAPGELQLERFLAPTPLRVLIDQNGDDITGLLPRLDAADTEGAPTGILEDHHALFEKLMPKLLEAANRKAAIQESLVKKQAFQEAENRLGGEAKRLRDLGNINPSVSSEEVDLAEKRTQAVLREITSAELRLDSVRWVSLGKMDLG